ncbi:MAG TPA: bifunctional [glutamine synthetase] adenylyltransferase/[glutamine synthetase]-adenylyl-L-tyrosine phosphorylase [Mycobacteriales bacterium]
MADLRRPSRGPGSTPAPGHATVPPRTPGTRPPSARGRLARYGLLDAGRAATLLGPGGLGLWEPETQTPVDDPAAAVLTALSLTGDPDLALLSLDRVAGAAGSELVDALRGDRAFRDRLLGVLGASDALADDLVSHPGTWRDLVTGGPVEDEPTAEDLRRELLAAVGGAPDSPPTWGSGGARARGAGADDVADLRTAYRRRLILLAARDVTGVQDFEAVAAELADLAGATVAAALAMAAAELPDDAPPARLAVVGLGKCGGRELNYISDVDVLYVAEPAAPDGGAAPDGTDPQPALRTATTLATTMMRICHTVAWPVDAALRPEGKDGPLVRTLASHEAYYGKWARTWEFQALLKARPLAGDSALGEAWGAMVAPLVWRAADRDGVVADVQAMRRRVEASLPAREADRELKLGPGGLRDIEFAVQLLQLVHGRADETLRSGTTLTALQALIDGGYVGRKDGDSLADSYRFLRTVEHRLQLQRLRRTHRLPSDEAGLRWLAQSLGFRADARGDAVAVFSAERARHAREVRRLHEKLFYRPLLEAVSRVPTEALRLSPTAATDRLGVLGFADPAGALRHLEALTGGVSRRAAIQRTLLPAMLQAFSDAPDPDAGLLAYRQVSDMLGRTPWYLRLLRDEGLVAVRMAKLLGTSRYVADLLGRDPEALQLLADDTELGPRPADALRSSFRTAVGRYGEPVAAVAAARALRRRELLRIGSADLLGLLDTAAVGHALSDVSEAVLDAALSVALRAVRASRGGGELPMRMAILAMGRLGGAEVGYGSDADVMFVHEPLPGAAESDAAAAASAVAEELRRLLSVPAPDPPLGVDASLRPEGRQGPLSRSLASFEAYYRRWSSVWEAQALLRARPIAGDRDVARRFEELADPVRYPDGGLSAASVTEIRRIKARVDAERLPRGADPATHTKLGRGGLADVEWTVQLIQLMHGNAIPALRTPSTLDALQAAVDAELLTEPDAAALAAAWRLATRVRNATMLVRGRPSDQLPRHGRELVGVTRAVGWSAGSDPGEFVDDYLRTMRRARQVVERVFYA